MNATSENSVEEVLTKNQNNRFKDFMQKFKKNKPAVVGSIMILFFLLIAFLGPYLMTHDPNKIDILNRFQGPSLEHWFGTDNNGRDIFSRILQGTSLTLYLGITPVAIGATLGIVLGVFAGFYGGWINVIIMRITDILLAFPGILLALAIISALGPSLNNVVIALAIYNIPVFIRIVQGSTLETMNLEYVEAVRALGARNGKIIFFHILPNVMSPIIVQTTLQVATSILSAASLSFLGLGAQPPTPEWGAMLSGGRDFMWEAPHVTFIPGIAIVLVIIAFNLLGDGLRDALDPRL